ncbi:uncharacterized protein F4822DRAFT_97046 [Hypoxylon trugodes]|uniref:uncharacterized protein n=1 Tax=Hypoxylon trugodes TaxID=326681 RepID=UPI002194968C|nr:uncharacterized protein F4822DRAFT_97046 [Hypoxylon trugodes]KAI1382790.1 hypothetical protein F4822DRAFT_97046 [Hypoxylon trugodes]
MVNLAIVPPILLIVLLAVAIYVQVTSSNLSLPLATGTTVLTIILPLIAAANIFYTPILRGILLRRAASSPVLQRLLPAGLQLFQGVLTVVLATLAAEGFVPGGQLDCSLNNNWQRLYSAHDDRAIERIQDAFNCCGLNTMKDRSAPQGQCRTLFPNRHTRCLEPWRAAEQRTAGFQFAVVVLAGILQLVNLASFAFRGSRNSNSRFGYRRIAQVVGVDTTEERLLEDGEAEVDEGGNGAAAGGDGTNGARRDYGGTGNGGTHYRVEPSSFGNSSERNQWADGA